jgi:hypothetical protein
MTRPLEGSADVRALASTADPDEAPRHRDDGGGAGRIDHDEASGRPLPHYLDHIEQRGWTYRAHHLPHDARARSYQTGTSTIELARERLGRVTALRQMRPASEPSKPSNVGFARLTLDERFEDYARQKARRARI